MAASPRPPSWAIEYTVLGAGVLGETAPAVAGRRRALVLGGRVQQFRDADAPWFWVVENGLVAAAADGEGAKAK